MTVGEAVDHGAATLLAAGLSDARREAEALVRAVIGVDPRLYPDRILVPRQADEYGRAVERRRRREPFAYIVGRREFWGLDLEVRPGVFIPRPETELVVERALALMPEGALVCDLCTGSGAVALAVALGAPTCCVDAVDISAAALDAATRNAHRLEVGDRVRMHQGDLFDGLPPERRGRYGLCTCNPPYVDAEDMATLAPDVRDWEPVAALVAPEGWEAMYRRIGRGAGVWLESRGRLICEVGVGQANGVAAILAAEGLTHLATHRDFAGIPRVVEVERP